MWNIQRENILQRPIYMYTYINPTLQDGESAEGLSTS